MKKVIFTLILSLIILLSFATILIAQTQTQLVIVAINNRIVYGTDVDIAGLLWSGSGEYENNNGINEKNITIQSRTMGTVMWKELETAKTFAASDESVTYNGALLHGVKPKVSTQYRAVFNQDENFTSSTSNTETILVEARVKISAKRSRKKEIIVFRGEVKPRHKRKFVIIKARKKGQKRYVRFAKVKTDNKSRFIYRWKTKGKEGKYQFRAYFSDKDHSSGVSKTLKINLR